MLGIELIQVALGTRKCLSHVPSAKEWREAYVFADKQSVIGICYGGVSRLPQDQAPNIELLMEWIGQAEFIKAQNELMNDKCRKLCEKLHNDGFWCCILKGQSNLGNYGLTPALSRREGEICLAEYRTPGDIDVWVRPMNSASSPIEKKVVGYVRQQNQLEGKKNDFEVVYHHVGWEFEDTPVELHMRPSWMYNPVTNRRLQRWCEHKSTELGNKGICGFPIPTNDFNRVYQLVHIYRHLFNEGIGLRQLLDYYMVLKTLPTPLSRGEYMHTLSRFGMKKFTAAVMWILKDVFGMADECLLCPPNEKYGRFLFDEVMKAGNFGKYDKRLTYDRTKTLERGWGRLKRMSRLMTFGPWEVVCAPGWKVWHYFWRKKQ